jgi:hypothetical protein
MPNQPEIIFLSYRESNAEENWAELKTRFPNAKRVHGVKGIYEAHRAAAELSDTDFFFLVDGDNKICESFRFELKEIQPKQDTIYVWRCLNPVNKLCYGYGAIKLYNKFLLSSEEREFRDLATTVARHYHIVHEVASETHFHATPIEAWRGAFRECVKLQCQVLENSNDIHSQQRLQKWCNDYNPKVSNSSWVKLGAKMAQDFVLDSAKGAQKAKLLINDFDQLEQLWQQVLQKAETTTTTTTTTTTSHTL